MMFHSLAYFLLFTCIATVIREALSISSREVEVNQEIVGGIVTGHGHRDDGRSRVHRNLAKEWYEVGDGMGTMLDNNARERKTMMGRAVASSASGNIVAVSSPRQAMAKIVMGMDVTPGENDEDDRSGHNIYVRYYPRVQVFEFNPRTDKWDQPSPDIEADDPLDEFGVSLAMDASGSTLVVGALNDKNNFIDAGSITVYQYDRAKRVWGPKGKNHRIDGTSAFENFGAAVDITDDGNVIVVGAPTKDTFMADAVHPNGGEVRVYKYDPDEDVWKMMGNIIRGEMFHRLGSAVSIAAQPESSRFVLAVGAPTAGKYENGYVQIFRFDTKLAVEGDMHIPWMTSIKDKIFGDADGDHFGASVALNKNGTIFVAGAPNHKGFSIKKKSGHVRVFYEVQEDRKWKEKYESIVGFDAGEEAGYSVAISPEGDRVAIGSPHSSKNGKHSGHVSVYYEEQAYDTRFWNQMNLDIDGGDAMDMAGASVAMAMNGDRVVIGSPGGGYARVFELAHTPPPTMSPTSTIDESSGETSKSGGENDLARRNMMEVLAIVFALIVPLIAAGAVAFLKGAHHVLRRPRSEPVPDSPASSMGRNGVEIDREVI